MQIKERFLKLLKPLALALLCSPVVGYILFSAYMPIVVWPEPAVPNVAMMVAVFVLMGLCVGMLLDTMESVVYSTFVIMVFGEIFAIMLGYSPILSGQILNTMSEEIAADVFRVSFPAALSCLLIFLISGFAGQAVHERWLEPEVEGE